VSTFYKVNLYTVLSTCNEVTFSCKYLLSTSLCSQPCRYRSRNVPTFIRLNTPLPASAACERLFSAAGRVFVPRRGRTYKRFEQHCSSCCNDSLSRHCHDKDVILIYYSDLSRPPRRVITPPPVFMRHPPNHLKFKGGYQGGCLRGCLCDRDVRGQILT